jgi:hypothetical protein
MLCSLDGSPISFLILLTILGYFGLRYELGLMKQKCQKAGSFLSCMGYAWGRWEVALLSDPFASFLIPRLLLWRVMGWCAVIAARQWSTADPGASEVEMKSLPPYYMMRLYICA